MNTPMKAAMNTAANTESPAFRTGMIAIVGRPNVGKSTLLNAIVGSHVSITSRKPQTTRNRVLGVLTRPDAQYVFVDTPGLQHRHRNLMTRRMNSGVASALHGVDAVVMVVDAHGWQEGDDAVLRLLPKPRPVPVVADDAAALGADTDARADGSPPSPPSRVILVLSKTDALHDKAQLLPRIADAAARYPFAAIIPVSAARGWQIDDLLAGLRGLLPEGMPLFEADQITDRSVRFLAAELVREQVFRLMGDELPYGMAVTIERWAESPGRAVIDALILVERESQRAMVIGAGGRKLREIGAKARAGIERLLEKPVFLQTHVRVQPGWNRDARALDQLGIES